MALGFSLRDEGALLIGGPQSGQVVKVPRGEDQVIVMEELEAHFTLEDESPMAPSPRTGIYRRQGTSSNFYWKGWNR